MNTLTTRRNHLVAARFLALASAARRAALNECVDWIERGIVIPPYCRIDAASARYYADQARVMRMRAIQSRCGSYTHCANRIPAPSLAPLTPEYATMTLATRRRHLVAARLYALAADARRAALKDGADQALAAIQADQARRMRDRAIAVRNGIGTY